MARYNFCCWCWKKVKVPADSDVNDMFVCSRGCRDAETIFRLYMSDEEINRREHYRRLTRGGDSV